MKQIREIEILSHRGHGLIEVICGPMFSGKSEELIRRIRRVQFARLSGLVFKPLIDNRFSAEEVVTHSSQRLRSVVVSSADEIHQFLGKLEKPPHVVGLDEAQFFGPEVVALAESLANDGMRVIVAGLTEDYLGQPFGPMPELLAHADSITRLWAVCMSCGAPASKSQRIAHPQGEKPSDSQVLVGAQDYYEARCRLCFVRGIVEPVVRPQHDDRFGASLFATLLN